MSKELEDAIYLLNLFDASDWKEEERQDKALEFLKSLIVDVPTSVAKWFESLPEKEKKLDNIEKLNVRMYLPQNVYD